MKSYLKFLSRNKLYTAIEAAGLIVSLAFVVIISCYVWQQLAITRGTPGYKNVYSLNMGGESFDARPGEMSIVQDRIPEVETASRVKKTNYFGKQISIDGQYIASKYNSVTEVDPSFFGFFPSTFVEGSEECLHDRNQLILEESFARLYFPDKDPVCVHSEIFTEHVRLKNKNDFALKVPLDFSAPPIKQRVAAVVHLFYPERLGSAPFPGRNGHRGDKSAD